LKKATSKVQEVKAEPQAVPAPQAERRLLPLLNLEAPRPRENWAHYSWETLMQFLEYPNLEDAEMVFRRAFERISAWGDLARQDLPSVPEETWPAVFDAVELDICMMRKAFETVHDELEKILREERGAVVTKKWPLEKTSSANTNQQS